MALYARGLPHIATRMSRSHLQFLASVVAVAVLATGCLVAPVPMTKRVHGYSGQPANDKFDLKFLRVGETKREEVLQKLQWADSGIKGERLFWGRWISSGSGVAWGIGGPGGGAGGTDRHWVAHNLFVEFDDHGTLSQVHEVSDGEIVPQLNEAFVRTNPADFDLSSPVELKAKHRKSNSIGDVVVHLTLEAMRVENSYGSKRNFQVSPERIQQLTTSGTADPVFTQVHLHLSEKTQAGTDPSFDMRPAELLAFAEYLRKVHPSALTPHTESKR
jgi:hypothetical protein